MGRRRHGTELKTPVTLALDPNTIATLDAFAARWGCSRSALIERLATDHLNDLCNPETIGQRVQNGTITPQQAHRANEIISCAHPKDQRQHHTWGATCGNCGRRIP